MRDGRLCCWICVQEANIGRGDDTVGNPHRAQIGQFELIRVVYIIASGQLRQTWGLSIRRWPYAYPYPCRKEFCKLPTVPLSSTVSFYKLSRAWAWVCMSQPIPCSPHALTSLRTPPFSGTTQTHPTPTTPYLINMYYCVHHIKGQIQ